jgi:hypothetical protein
MTSTDPPREPTAAETQAFADRFRAAMRERGVELSCPLCGADDWRAFGDVAVNQIEGRNPTTGEIDRIPGSVHALAASCAKCGFLPSSTTT